MEAQITDIKVGDSVYWRIRVGMFNRTLGGKVEEINDGIATVSVQTQNIYGKRYKKSVGDLTKNKKQ
jgi:hypothetical protein